MQFVALLGSLFSIITTWAVYCFFIYRIKKNWHTSSPQCDSLLKTRKWKCYTACPEVFIIQNTCHHPAEYNKLICYSEVHCYMCWRQCAAGLRCDQMIMNTHMACIGQMFLTLNGCNIWADSTASNRQVNLVNIIQSVCFDNCSGIFVRHDV